MNWYKYSNVDDTPKLVLTKMPGHTWEISVTSKDQELLKKFIATCRNYKQENRILSNPFFWQSGSRIEGDGKYPEYQMFEFLGETDENKILNISQDVANKIGLELDLQ